MRAAAVLSEALRNLATGTTRAAVLGLAACAVTAGPAAADARYVVALERQAAEFVAAGASVRTLVAEGMTDGAACEGLAGEGPIRSSGALRAADPVPLRAMPGDPLPAFEVTPGLARVLGVDAAAAEGVWLPRELADTLGAEAGTRLPADEGTLTVAGVYAYPDDGRDRRLGYAVLVPRGAAAVYDECWAEVWPVSPSADELIATAADVVADPATTVSVRQLNSTLGRTFDGAERFASRPTRYAAPACAALGAALGFIAVRTRRLEYAGALHCGVSRGALLAMVLIETAAWAGAALAVGAAVLVAAAWTGHPGDPAATYLAALRGPAAALPAALLGACAALALIRERHLFRYFKGR
jgi:hypothetical protein